MLRLPLSVVRLARAAGQLADTHDDGHHQQGNHRRQTVGHGCVWNNTHISFQLLTAAYSPGDGAAAPIDQAAPAPPAAAGLRGADDQIHEAAGGRHIWRGKLLGIKS